MTRLINKKPYQVIESKDCQNCAFFPKKGKCKAKVKCFEDGKYYIFKLTI